VQGTRSPPNTATHRSSALFSLVRPEVFCRASHFCLQSTPSCCLILISGGLFRGTIECLALLGVFCVPTCGHPAFFVAEGSQLPLLGFGSFGNCPFPSGAESKEAWDYAQQIWFLPLLTQSFSRRSRSNYGFSFTSFPSTNVMVSQLKPPFWVRRFGPPQAACRLFGVPFDFPGFSVI